MSFKALNHVWQLQGLNSSEKLVLLSLADQANDDGICWPAQKSIAKRTGLARETVNRTMKRLHEKMLIEIFAEPNSDRTRYEVLMWADDIPPDKKSQGVIERHRGVTEDHMGCDRASQPSEPPINHQRTNGASAPRIWDAGREILGGQLLGKTLKEHDDAKVKDAIVKTLLKDPADPKTYLLGILKEGDTSAPIWQKTDKELVALAREKNISTSGKSRQELINALR